MVDSEPYNAADEDDGLEEGEDATTDDNDDDQVERDPITGDIVAYRVENEFVDAEHPTVVRRYSTVMVQADADDHKFIGLVRNFIEVEQGDEVILKVALRWFYRFHDMEGTPVKLLRRKAVLRRSKPGTVKSKGGDMGLYKEVALSDHLDDVPVETIMHAVKVWFLPDESLDPVKITPPPAPAAAAPSGAGGATAPGSSGTATRGVRSRSPSPAPRQPAGTTAAAAASAAAAAPLLPGFVCRRLVLAKRNMHLMRLGEVASKRKQLDSGLVDDVAEMLRRSEGERKAFAEEWRRRTAARAAAAPSAAAPS